MSLGVAFAIYANTEYTTCCGIFESRSAAESAAETGREAGLDACVDHRASYSKPAVQFQSGEIGDDAREPRRTFRAIVRSERTADWVAAGLTNAEIATRLIVSPATAKTHVRRIEVPRVLKPGGELRFMEHVRSGSACKARLQRGLDRSAVWPRLAGGCHCARDTVGAIEAAAFELGRLGNFDLGPSWLSPTRTCSVRPGPGASPPSSSSTSSAPTSTRSTGTSWGPVWMSDEQRPYPVIEYLPAGHPR